MTTLTPVQAAVLAPEAHGRDLIVSARTGSGKTVAFGLAMAANCSKADRAPWARTPLAPGHRADPRARDAGQPELEWLYAAPARGSSPASAAWTR